MPSSTTNNKLPTYWELNGFYRITDEDDYPDIIKQRVALFTSKDDAFQYILDSRANAHTDEFKESSLLQDAVAASIARVIFDVPVDPPCPR